MEVINKYRKELIILGVIIEIILVPLIVRNIISLKNKDNNSNNFPNNHEVGKQELGIMYRDSDTDQYKTYSGSIMDAINNSYELNLTNSKCSDGSGATVTPSSVLSISGSTVTIKSNKTVYCTLYFDLNSGPEILKGLRKKDSAGTLSKGIVGDMYRYQGTGDVPNWICFGTTDNCGANDDLIDKYMYRIIGITEEGEMKLVKETFVEEGPYSGFSWNDEWKIDSGTDLCPNGICPEWNEADLFQRINGTANGTKSGSGAADDKVDNDTDIFIDSEQYDYLRSGDSYNGGTKASTWYNLISEHDWMYGDTTEDTYNGNTAYQIETGQKETIHYIQEPVGSTTVVYRSYKWPGTNKVKAKISLMYMHDYLYSYPEGNPGNGKNIKNSWIYFRKDGYNTKNSYEWLSTRFGVNDNGLMTVQARLVSSDGYLVDYGFYLASGVRPVFYLTPDVTIKDGGEGTKTNPFILDVK